MFDDTFKKSKKALLIGMGGGGDILGCIPTANYLKFLGVESILGGLTWERKVVDPKPGPRRMDEIQDIKLLSDNVGLASPKRRLVLTPIAAITLYFDPAAVYEISRPAQLIDGTKTLRDADRILRDAGFITELYIEEQIAGEL